MDLRRVLSVGGLVLVVAMIAAAAWATGGFGKEQSSCPRNDAAVSQPKEGPGRPLKCP